MNKVKVLIVEDSKLMQEILSQIISADPEIEVVGVAGDPIVARDLIKEYKPDVITLDIMMPHMDGLTFLKNLMRLHPMPVIMISSLTQSGSSFSLEALAVGAIDYVQKPTQQELTSKAYADHLQTVVKEAANARVRTHMVPDDLATRSLEPVVFESRFLRHELIAIGASTGGVEAIESVLLTLPKVLPPILITQHIKKEFCAPFAKRINKICNLNVSLAKPFEELLPGNVYIAPGDYHLEIERKQQRYFSVLTEGEPINGHKPSVDALFFSLAKAAGDACVAVLLTGMGSDGAKGLKAIEEAGGVTIIQDKETSVVWGMPSAALKLNAANFVEPLERIPIKILQVLDKKASAMKRKG